MATWTWRFEKADGAETQPAVEPEEFTTQGDAESWLGEYWKPLLMRRRGTGAAVRGRHRDLRPDEPEGGGGSVTGVGEGHSGTLAHHRYCSPSVTSTVFVLPFRVKVTEVF